MKPYLNNMPECCCIWELTSSFLTPSNQVTYPEQYLDFAVLLPRVREAGGVHPQMRFLSFGNSSSTFQKLWNEFYSKNLSFGFVVQWEVKPFILAILLS
jgi:hypothetical protein